MRGTIRVVLGLFLVMGAVGGMDAATDGELLALTGLAVLGLLSMFSGTEAMKRM